MCKPCFIHYVEKKISKTISRYNLIQSNDTIAVGVSWGKDSFTMLYNLYNRQKKIRNAKKLIAINIDEGITGYREKSRNMLREFINKFDIDVDLIEVNFKDEFGLGLDELSKNCIDRSINYNTCTICGTIRRRLLNDVARRAGANKIAIGHNLDDVSQTLILNILRNDINKIVDSPPFSSISLQDNIAMSSIDHSKKNNTKTKKFVTRIKPLVRLPEKEIALYCNLKGFTLQSNPCPFSNSDPILRRKVQQFLNQFDERNHEIKYNLLNAHINLFSLNNDLTNKESSEMKYNLCPNCGEPSGLTRKICLYCDLKEKLKKY